MKQALKKWVMCPGQVAEPFESNVIKSDSNACRRILLNKATDPSVLRALLAKSLPGEESSSTV